MGIYKKTLQNRADELNCEIEIDDNYGGGMIYVYPPEGSCFGATGTEVLAYQFSNGDQSWKPEVYEEIYKDLELGLRKI